jgi:hypothetical protein
VLRLGPEGAGGTCRQRKSSSRRRGQQHTTSKCQLAVSAAASALRVKPAVVVKLLC